MTTEKKKFTKTHKIILISLAALIVFIMLLPEPDKPVLPEYKVIKSDLDDKFSSYRVLVGDSLPNETQALAVLEEITKNDPAPKSHVFLYRKGFEMNSGADARIEKTEEGNSYELLTVDNSKFQKAAGYTFDSIPTKKELFSGLSNMGAKWFIYELENGKFIKVFIFAPGSYQLEDITKDPANGGDIYRFYYKDEHGTFTNTIDTYKKTITITDQNGAAIDVHRLL